MLFSTLVSYANGRALIFTFSGTQVRIAEIERLQSLFKMSMGIGLGLVVNQAAVFIDCGFYRWHGWSRCGGST